LRRDHGAQRQLLSLHELRVDERLFLGTLPYFYWSREASLLLLLGLNGNDASQA
jgi:hypothetical protein